MRAKVIIVLVLGCAGFYWLHSARARKMPAKPAAEVTWLTDASAALAAARSENRTVLLDFTGSDWCGWCIKLDEEVFATEEFAEYAKKNLVLVKVDFPRSKQLPAKEQQQNELLARQYGVTGFPTIVVLKPNGDEKGRLGYRPGGPKPWLETLRTLQ